MPKFFVPHPVDKKVIIDGEDGRHLAKSLRMKAGEGLIVTDNNGVEHDCVIDSVSGNSVSAFVRSSKKTEAEPGISLHLFQCVPKSGKLETVVRQTVELGISSITPVLSARCISRPDSKTAAAKTERLKSIAKEAAQQSGRGMIPLIYDMISFEKLTEKTNEFDLVFFCYESGGIPLKNAMRKKKFEKCAIIIGPEGGFELSEADKLIRSGAEAVTLGPRILRAETAPICAVSAVMFETGNLE